jgi:phosphatidylethanolamine/phosphatidyl-N-methylethanolamine N-methyltransferase
MTKAQNISKFLGEFLLHPTTTGAIAPSSKYLAQTMVSWINLPAAKTVLEYGPGTGAFTDSIVRSMPPNGRFAAIELNERLAELFRQRHPSLTLVQDSVANVAAICRKLGFQSVDCIVCGLPWASFQEALQTEILNQMMSVLGPKGQFVTFAYLQGLLLPAGRRFASLLPRYFSQVTKSRTVWRNLPPAFVYQCQR